MNLNLTAATLDEQKRMKAEEWLRPRVFKTLAKIRKRIDKGKDAKAILHVPYRVNRLQGFSSNWGFIKLTEQMLKEEGIETGLAATENQTGRLSLYIEVIPRR